jgi:hypothetical protein
MQANGEHDDDLGEVPTPKLIARADAGTWPPRWSSTAAA